MIQWPWEISQRTLKHLSEIFTMAEKILIQRPSRYLKRLPIHQQDDRNFFSNAINKGTPFCLSVSWIMSYDVFPVSFSTVGSSSQAVWTVKTNSPSIIFHYLSFSLWYIFQTWFLAHNIFVIKIDQFQNSFWFSETGFNVHIKMEQLVLESWQKKNPIKRPKSPSNQIKFSKC